MADKRPFGNDHIIVLCFLLVAYWGISLRNITIVPPVYEDEPWLASTGWKLATDGVFGSDVFRGIYGMERNYYDFLPVFPFLLSGVFRGLGVGLFQARFATIALGLLVLVLTYALARRLFRDERIGHLAVLFLLVVRLTGLTRTQETGILFLDVARIARYDMAVPVFGLAALHAYLTARQSSRRLCYGLAGILAGLSGLAHVYGLFWLPVLLVLIVWDGWAVRQHGDSEADAHLRAWLPAAGWLISGFALCWAPYIAYVLSNVPDWRGQTAWYGDRFDLLNLGWYVENVRQELQRYGPGLGPLPAGILLRAGFLSTVVALPLSLAALAWRALRRSDWQARFTLVPLVVFPVLFALLIRPKVANYAIAFIPCAAIVAAWGTRRLWAWLGATRLSFPGRIVLAALLLAVVSEGLTRLSALDSAARTTTPYAAFIENVRRYLPPGSGVLGLHNYWFGLQDYDFRSFMVPLVWTGSSYTPRPLAFDDALDRVAPDVVLMDSRMLAYFEELRQEGDPRPELFSRWLNRHNVRILASIDDPTYGLMQIYGVGGGE